MTVRQVTPRQLAEAIGVSESSLKRWSDAGKIEVSRTEGGHRRIAIGEAVRFIRASRAPVVRPDLLGLPRSSATGEALTELLVKGESRAVIALRIADLSDAEISARLAISVGSVKVRSHRARHQLRAVLSPAAHCRAA